MSAGDSAQQVFVAIPCTSEQHSQSAQTCTYPLSCQLTNPNLKTRHLSSEDKYFKELLK